MNNLRFLTATHILPMNQALPEDSVLVFEEDKLIEVARKQDLDPIKILSFDGTLIPGFVNAHCHLELSHMKGKIGTGTGLTSFLKGVVTQSPTSEEVIQEAIRQADQEMWNGGIVAVGDISNKSVTVDVKKGSPVEYYTFVEMFDFLDPEKADGFYDQYNTVYHTFKNSGLKNVSMVPHSPYTVSRKLGERLANTLIRDMTGSIHMLENEQENLLLMGKRSEYFGFFQSLGFPMETFQPPGRGSMESFMEGGYKPDRMLFVHNTVAGRSDLEEMKKYDQYGKAYLVTCPNANLYIESRLPDYDLWVESGLPVCIGTDSYSSNHQLSVWSEICTIKSHFASFSWEELIRWGTIEGARALGMEEDLGSLQPGKRPGLVLLEHRNEETFGFDTVPRRLI